MKQNSRVVDLTIETPGHENQEDEFYMKYDKEQMALYGFDIHAAHSTLRGILSGYDIGCPYVGRYVSEVVREG